ncbi:hypothetical protein BH10ACT9_BH10ACT9_53410 [soil metagenome]
MDVSANGALHWVPLDNTGLRTRMALIADWVARARPAVVVTDVSVEVAVLVRLLGIPVVVLAMPGQRDDSAHELAYRLADHIVAPWPPTMYEPTCLRLHRHKTSYVGGISRFDGRARTLSSAAPPTRVLAMFGTGGSAVDAAALAESRDATPQAQWRCLGAPGGQWSDDPWDDLCAADVVIAHAGQGSVADIAAAGKPAIVIPQDRPFGEQDATASVLAAEHLAIVTPQWPEPTRWPALIAHAQRCDGDRWQRWQTSGAAGRAAAAIENVACRNLTCEDAR